MSIKRNLFNWGHTCSTTLKTGEFTPVLSTVVPPNTTISGDMLFGVTADVPLRPVKWDFYFEAVAFVTPRRILYDRDRYQRFITGAANGKVLPDDHEDSVSANFKMPVLETESVLCHCGWQDGIKFNFAQTTEELRAIAMIWNWYVRDENLDDEIEVPLTSGEDDPSTWWPNYDKASGMLHVNQFKDYFTCAANAVLKGSPVPVPQYDGGLVLDPTSSLIVSTGNKYKAALKHALSIYVWDDTVINAENPFQVRPFGTAPTDNRYKYSTTYSSGDVYESGTVVATYNPGGVVTPQVLKFDFTGAEVQFNQYNQTSGAFVKNVFSTSEFESASSPYEANLANVKVVPTSQLGVPMINDLRFAVQREISKIMDMRAGNRYNEFMKTHYNSDVGDNLIQIPQFVAACKQRIRFSSVLQTSAATDEDPLGSFGGFAQTGDRLRVNWYCPEESILQVFAFIRPRPGYQQGAARWRSELTRFDRYDTPYAHLGMQALKGREICVTGTDFDDQDWAYQDIYDHLRHSPSHVNGLFRTSKSMWTGQRIFNPAKPPLFNKDFIKVTNNDSDRLFSASGVAPWVVDIDCGFMALAPLPKRGTPGLMDHIRV